MTAAAPSSPRAHASRRPLRDLARHLARHLARLVVLALTVGGLSLLTLAPARAAGPGGGDGAPARAVAKGINLALDASAQIRGLVYDDGGDLLDNIVVEAVPADDPTGEPVATNLTYEDGDSASHGAYTLWVPPGDYLVRFSSPEWARRDFATAYYGGGRGETVTVGADDERDLDPVTLVEDHGSPVSGSVVDGAGAPLADIGVALVRFYSGGYYDTVDYEVTAADGTYTFPAVRAARSYTVLAYGRYNEDGDYLGLPNVYLGQRAAAEHATRFDGTTASPLAAITLSGAQLTGSVLGLSPEGVQDAEVYLYAVGDDGSLDYAGYDYVYDYGDGDTETAFSLPVIPGETYTVAIYSYDRDFGSGEYYLGGSYEPEDATRVVPPAEGLDVGAIQLGAGSGRVSVAVVDGDGDPITDDSDVDVYLRKRLEDGSYDYARTLRWSESAQRWITRVSPGHTYTVAVYDYATDEPQVFLGDTTDAGAARTFDGSTDDQDLGTIHLGQGTSGFLVHVVDADGQPVDREIGVRVWRTDDGEPYVVAYAKALGGGDFKARMTWGTHFTLEALDWETGDSRFLGDESDVASATSLLSSQDVPQSDVGTITLATAPTRVQGRVVDADGAGVAYADVILYGFSDGSWSYLTDSYTDRRGYYSIRSYGDDWSGYEALTVAADDDEVPRTFLGQARRIEDATTFAPATGAVSVEDIVLRPSAFAGTVTQDGEPAAGATVRLYGYYGECTYCYDVLDDQATDETGAYRFVARSWYSDYETFSVSADVDRVGYPETFLGGSTRGEDAVTVPLPEGTADLDPIDVVVPPDSLSGTVSTEDGLPLTGEVYLTLYRWNAEGGYFDYAASDYLYDRDEDGTTEGRYAFYGLEPGSYAVQASYYAYDGHQYLDTWTGGGAMPAGPDAPGVFAVDGAAPVQGADIALRRGQVVQGTVTADDGTPLGGVSVYVYAWENYGCDEGCDYLGTYWYGSTDQHGHYDVPTEPGRDLSVVAYRTGFATYYLGGEAYPSTRTPDNTLPASDGSPITHDVSMTPEWAAVGQVAGQRLSYCLAQSGYAAEFDGHRLTDLGGVVRDGDEWSYWFGQDPFDALNRDAALAPLWEPAGGWATTWGVSPDGDTLCVLTNPGGYDNGDGTVTPYGPVFQMLVTKDGADGYDVQYRYDTVPADYVSSSVRAGWSDGNGASGDTTLLGSGLDLADGGSAALIAGHTDGEAPGVYAFHFDGFDVRGAAPEDQGGAEITHDGDVVVGSVLGVAPGSWSVDGEDDPAGLEFAYLWHDGRGRVLSKEPTWTVDERHVGRRVHVHIRAWLPGHAYSEDGYAQIRIPKPAGPPAAFNDAEHPETVAPSLGPDGVTPGGDLVVDPGTWTPGEGLTAEDLSYSYAWFRNGSRIRHSGPSLTTADRFAGDTFRVVVTASAADHSSVPVSTNEVTVGEVPQLPRLEPTVDPSVSGSVQVGQTLVLDPGAWDAGDGSEAGTMLADGTVVTYAVRWAVDGYARSADAGSDGFAFTLDAGDEYRNVAVRVTASAPGYRSGTWSADLGAIAPEDVDLEDLTLTVVGDTDSAPVQGAYVYVCQTDTWSCLPVVPTGADGVLRGQVVAGTQYYVYVSSPDSSLYRNAEGYVTTEASGPTTYTVRLVQPTPPPANVSIPTSNGTYDGVPTVYWQQDQDFRVTGCAGVVDPAYTVTFSDGTAPRSAPLSPLGEPVDGLVTYQATIPAFYPSHGDTTISTNVPATCAPDAVPTVINIYIDPSGVVVDQYGRPIVGASVTLQRSDDSAGPFVTVPDGSDIMSPANRTNPDTTDEVGFFQWDVTEGYYRVRVDATGCSPATTDPMAVPPARIDLLIKLTCDDAAPTGTVSLTGTPKVGRELSTDTSGWGAGYEVAVQWLRDGSPIEGATGSTYTLVAADRGHDVSVRHTVTKATYVQESGNGAPVSFSPFQATSGSTTVGVGDAPTASTAAAITGSGTVGSTLTLTSPTWSLSGVTEAVQWQRDGSPISGETGTSYAVQPSDVGHALRAVVTGSKDGYADGTSTSNAVTALLGDAPTADPAAAVAGSGKVGSTLTLTSPTWSLSGVTDAVQWTRDGSAITGETGSSYAVQPSDVGHDLAAVVTGSKTGYHDGTSTSNAVTAALGDAPTADVAPTLAGSGKVGSTLTATAPQWSLSGVTDAVRWQLDGSDIAGETGSTYEVRPGDLGHQLTAVFTGARSGYHDGSATTAATTAIIGNAPTAPAPMVTGSGKVGDPLTVTAPTWSLAGTATTYQWRVGGEDVDGATGTGYTPVAADLGKDVVVVATGTRTGYAVGSATSAATPVTVGDAANLITAPVITGTPKVGQVLSVSTGTWEAEGLTFAYQWRRDGADITGATGATYTPVVADATHALDVVVTASRAGYTPGTATTAPVTIAQLVSKTKAVLGATKIPASKKGSMTVTVSVPGVLAPLGKVAIMEGTKVLTTVKLAAKKKGVVVVTLPKLKAGKHTLVATYLGTASVAGSKAKKVVLTVTK